MTKDIRWIQRYSNFKKALNNLNEAVELSSERDLSKLEKQGLIQAFEYTYELAWNTVRDFYLVHRVKLTYMAAGMPFEWHLNAD